MATLAGLLALAAVIFFVVFIIKAIRKKEKRLWGIASLLCFILAIIFAFTLASNTPDVPSENKIIAPTEFH